MTYAKVSFGLELWKNRSEEDYKTSLLDMRPGEDWILDAMYIDDLRMRNKLSFDVWKIISLDEQVDNNPERNRNWPKYEQSCNEVIAQPF